MSERVHAVVGGESPAGRSSGAEGVDLLGRGGPREVLARIVPGDPLRLRARAARRARERALLVDPDQAALRAMALVAAGALRYRGRPRLEAWLDERVDEALDELVEESRDARPTPNLEVYGRKLGLAPAAVAQGIARFHALGRDDRDAFCRVVLEAQPLDDAARGAGCNAAELARRARRALCAFGAEDEA